MKINWKSELQLTATCLGAIGTVFLVITQVSNVKKAYEKSTTIVKENVLVVFEEKPVIIVQEKPNPNAKLVELMDEYITYCNIEGMKREQNKLRASQSYSNPPPLPVSPLTIVGKITNIDKTFWTGEHYMVLECDNGKKSPYQHETKYTVYCYVSDPNEVYKYNNGQNVSISGNIKNVSQFDIMSDGHFTFTNCSVVEVLN